MRHSLAPWTHATTKHGVDLIISHDNFTICEVFHPQDIDILQGNIRLIQEAPNLLYALKHMANIFDGQSETMCEDEDEAIECARAVIAAAEATHD
jgi:hypothetical protein